MGMQYDSDQIAEILPHRYPFALVDRIVDGEPGKWARGIKCVTVNEPFFQGHFPQKPIMPGVLHIEAIAQACGLMCLCATTKDATGGAKSYDTILTGIEGARFRKMILPGDTMRIETSLIMQRTVMGQSMGKAKGVVTIDGKVATEATVSFALIPRKEG